MQVKIDAFHSKRDYPHVNIFGTKEGLFSLSSTINNFVVDFEKSGLNQDSIDLKSLGLLTSNSIDSYIFCLKDDFWEANIREVSDEEAELLCNYPGKKMIEVNFAKNDEKVIIRAIKEGLI